MAHNVAVTAADILRKDAPAGEAQPSLSAPASMAPGRRNAMGIAAALRRAILDGDYGYGDRLPPERELARLFAASRTTVRRALSRLEETRLVVRRVGSGTFVSHLPSAGEEEIAEITSPLELIEVRLAVEPHMTRLAVINATGRDVGRLGEALARLEDSESDADHFTRADQQFHQLLAESTHNPLMVWIYRRINAVRSHAQWDAIKNKILSVERIAVYNRQHSALYEALRSRDIDGAVTIVSDHLRQARRDLLGADSE